MPVASTLSKGAGVLDRRELLTWLARGCIGAVAGGLPTPASSGAAPQDSLPLTVLDRVTVIDGNGSAPIPDAAVVLTGDRIAAIGRHLDVAPPPPVRVIDLSGKFVIPGLWDMHTHLAFPEQIFPPLHVVHGVTGIREMWGFPETHTLRGRIERGELLGPRMVVASTIIDGPPGRWPGSAVVSTEAEARAQVRAAHQQGADFLKVYSALTRETFGAVAEEAGRVGLRFAGHVPYRIPVAEAVAAGQYAVEHMYGMLLSTSARAPELYARIDAMPDDPAHPDGWGARGSALEFEAAETHSPERAAELFELLIARGSWQCPTLAVQRRARTGFVAEPDDPADAAMSRYLPDWLREFAQASVKSLPPTELALRQRNSQARDRLLGAMSAAGVGIVAGTDAGNPHVYPGYSLHEELELLVAAGLSPLRALQAATRDAARCAGFGAVSGTVEPGRYADLVVLDRNPLDSIDNTRSIHAVVCRGRYLDPAERAGILSEVEAAARQQSGALPAGGFGGCCG